jgi:hypothetical protein
MTTPKALGSFGTLLVDELACTVKIGPTPNGEWVTIMDWGDQEFAVLKALASCPRGIAVHDTLRGRNGKLIDIRQTIYRIRKRLIGAEGLPRDVADKLIRTNHGHGYQL